LLCLTCLHPALCIFLQGPYFIFHYH
jgi:hypothetical protein